MPEAPLVVQLNHLINSPLAAIRYALYLAGVRSNDPQVLRYLKLADEEVTFIAQSLRDALAQSAAGDAAAGTTFELHKRSAAA